MQNKFKSLIIIISFFLVCLSLPAADLINEKTEYFHIIPIYLWETELIEANYTYLECETRNCKIDMGRKLNADLIVVGDLAQKDGEYTLPLLITRVSDREIKGTAFKTFPNLNTLFQDMEKTVRALLSPRTAVAIHQPSIPSFPWLCKSVRSCFPRVRPQQFQS